MNTHELRRVAAAIELEPESFQMTTWIEPNTQNLCGTVGCIAGTAVRLIDGWVDAHGEYDPDEGWMLDDSSVSHEAQLMLDLSNEERCRLFTCPYWWKAACGHLGLDVPEHWHNLMWISSKHAATVLYALADGTITIEQFRLDAMILEQRCYDDLDENG